jgi:hypothetical protein
VLGVVFGTRRSLVYMGARGEEHTGVLPAADVVCDGTFLVAVASCANRAQTLLVENASPTLRREAVLLSPNIVTDIRDET